MVSGGFAVVLATTRFLLAGQDFYPPSEDKLVRSAD